MIRQAKARGVQVTCETVRTAVLTDDACLEAGTIYPRESARCTPARTMWRPLLRA